jgi:hypothetical protein
MATYPLTVGEIISWFRSKENALSTLGIILAGVHERSGTAKPSAFADFDAVLGMGRIIVWVSGEIDLEVLRISDGKNVLVRHEKVSNLDAPSLQDAFNEFVKSMKHPDNDSVPI